MRTSRSRRPRTRSRNRLSTRPGTRLRCTIPIPAFGSTRPVRFSMYGGESFPASMPAAIQRAASASTAFAVRRLMADSAVGTRRNSRFELSRRGLAMSYIHRTLLIAASAFALVATGLQSFAQGGLPNPYRPVRGLADGGGPFVPGGEWAMRPAGPPASVYIDVDGESLWAVIRCDETSPVPLASGGRFGADCLGPDNKIKNIDTI